MADSASSKASASDQADLGYELTARHAFLDYQVGDKIKDPATIAEILSGDLAVYVVRSAKAE